MNIDPKDPRQMHLRRRAHPRLRTNIERTSQSVRMA